MSSDPALLQRLNVRGCLQMHMVMSNEQSFNVKLNVELYNVA